MTRIVAGVDGGGTRTRVALSTESGHLLAIGEAGSGNYHDVGANGFAGNLNLAISRAWETARCEPRRLDAVFLGLGSVVTSEDRAAIRQVVEAADWAPPELIGVDHDLRIAHTGCLGGAPGIVLIAGTGSSCYGRDADGNSWKAGGWGPLLDDLGSGHWLGRQAMIAVIRESDGRGSATTLTPAVLDALGLDDPLQILRRVELQGMSRSEIAGLARVVLAKAAAGDRVSRAIIEQGTTELASLVATVDQKLGLGELVGSTPVAATGGLVDAGEPFVSLLRRAIMHQLPRSEFVESKAPPVIGAVMLALSMLDGGAASTEAAQRLLTREPLPA